MSRMRAGVVVPIAVGLLSLLTLVVKFGIPQHYEVRDRLAGINVFWHDDEAFIFVNQSGDAHRYSWLSQHAPAGLRLALMRSGIEEWRMLDHSTKAYHLTGGRLEASTLEKTPMFPAWDLEDGKLVAHSRFEAPGVAHQGFRWTGSGWQRVDGGGPPPEAEGDKRSGKTLKADDEEEEGSETEYGALPPQARDKLKGAGWHFKTLSGYEGIRESVDLPIDLRGDGYSLTLGAVGQTAQKADLLLNVTVSVSLAGKALPSAQILFSGGSPREVSRVEFDRVAAKGPGTGGPQGPGGVIAEVMGLLVPVVGAALALSLLWKGPTRGLKIAFLVFLIAWVMPGLMTTGWRSVLPLLIIPPVIGIVTMVASTRLIRYRTRRTLTVVGEDSCPAYAKARVRELTAAFEAVGFRFHGDRQNTWQMMSQDRRTFIRFFSHSSRHVWAEIQATDEPRTVGRMLCSLKGDTSLLTGDLQSNQELLHDAKTVPQRVPRTTSCADMLMAHETLATKTPGTPRAIEDPVAADVEGYNRWVDALVQSRQVTTAGDWFKISPRAAVPITLRVMAAWLH